MKKISVTILAALWWSISCAQVSFSKLSGPNGGGIVDIEFNSSGNIFLIAGSANGPSGPISGSVYRSTNSGTSWTKVSTGSNGLTDFDAYDILIDGSDKVYVLGKTKIYKSTNNGSTWTSVTPSPAFTQATQLAKTDDGDLYVVDTFDGVLRSVDDGVNWNNISSGLPGPSNFAKIINIGNDIYVGDLNNGTWKAIDPSNNSPTWVDDNSGLSTPDQPSSFALKGSVLYQSNRNGAYYFDGSNWVVIAQDNNSLLVNTYISENFNSGGHGVVIGSGSRVFLFFQDGNTYYNDNVTVTPWTKIDALNVGDNIHAMASKNTTVVVGYSRLGLQRSTNSGSSWGFSDSGIYLASTGSFVMTDNGRYIVSDGSSYLSISDNGTSWTKTQVDGSCTGCSFSTLVKLANGDILAIGNSTYRSLAADNGSNWTSEGTHAQYVSKAVTSDGTNFYGYTYGSPPTFLTSGDQASSFSTLSITGLPASFDVRGIAVDGSSNLFVYLYNNSTFQQQIFKISSGTATQVTNAGLSNGIDAVSGYGGFAYLLGRNSSGNRVVVKSNGGSSWTTVSSGGNTPDLNDLFVVNSDILVGYSHNSPRVMYYTNDGGGNWVQGFTESNDNSGLVGAVLDASNFLSVAISNAPFMISTSGIVPPVAPTNLKKTGVGESAVGLEWDHDGLNVDKFVVQRKLSADPGFTSLDSISANELYYVDQTVSPGKSYVYRVVAYSKAGSNISSNLSVTSKTHCTNTIPENRSWTATVSGFTPQSVGIQKFNSSLYYITDFTTGSLQDVMQQGSSGTYGISQVPAYFYDNCGAPFILPNQEVEPDGNGSWDGTTLTLHFQINKKAYVDTELTVDLVLNADDPAPVEPQNLEAYAYDNNSVQVQWTSDLYQLHYSIYRSTTSGFTPSGANKIATVDYPTVTYLDAGPFTNGTTYYYRMTATNGNSSPLPSGPSTEVGVTFKKPNFVLATNAVTAINASTPFSAWADFNGDGKEDLMLSSVTSSNAGELLLFKNTGTGFQQISGAITSGPFWGTPTVGDYDNDGNPDVFLPSLTFDDKGPIPPPHKLFKNTGGFSFVETAATFQIDTAGAFNASWIDYNNDGKLDMYIDNQYPGMQALYQGDGTLGFVKVTTGDLATDMNPDVFSAWADYDGDGDMDVLIVSSDGDVNDAFRLFKNDNGTFTKVSSTAFDAADDQRIFTASWGDYDNDLDLDLFAGNQDGKNYLFKNNGDGTFTKVADVPGTPTEDVSSFTLGSGWADIDNDGDLDLLVANGFNQPSKLYRNDGGGNLTELNGEMVTNTVGFRVAVSFADYNQDGFLDLHLGELSFAENGPAPDPGKILLFQNNNTTGNWVEIKCVGAASNVSAIGTSIIVTAGAKKQLRQIVNHSGTGSQSSSIAHFGLGSATKISDIEVKWPSGVIQHLTNQDANQLITIIEESAPSIDPFTAPASEDVGFSSTTFSIHASTPFGTIQQATLHHRKISGSSYASTAGTFNSATGDWDFTVNESFFDNDGMEYYFDVDNGLGTAQEPSGNSTFITNLKYTGTTALIPSTSLGFGGQKSNWKVFSIPFELSTSDKSVTQIFDEFSALTIKSDWRLITYKDETAWGEFPADFSTISRGIGYFINIKDPFNGNIVVGDGVIAPNNSRADLFQMDLVQGWNMIGNPYLTPISWSDVSTFNSLSGAEAALKQFSSGSYTANPDLGAYQGGFVFMAAAKTISIPFKGQTSPGGRKADPTPPPTGKSDAHALSNDISTPNWQLPIALSQGGVTTKLAAVGMAENASSSFDNYDDVTPPRFFDYLEVNFKHPEFFAHKFSRDIVPTAAEQEWDFTAESNQSGTATLTWDNTKFGNNSLELYLYDASGDQAVNMREKSSYSFDLHASRSFKIYFGVDARAKVMPDFASLGKAWPNPSTGTVNIPFALSEKIGLSRVNLEVFDLMGKKVATLMDCTLSPDFYVSQWDARNEQVKNGFYTYRLVVSAKGGQHAYTGKLIINK